MNKIPVGRRITFQTDELALTTRRSPRKSRISSTSTKSTLLPFCNSVLGVTPARNRVI